MEASFPSRRILSRFSGTLGIASVYFRFFIHLLKILGVSFSKTKDLRAFNCFKRNYNHSFLTLFLGSCGGRYSVVSFVSLLSRTIQFFIRVTENRTNFFSEDCWRGLKTFKVYIRSVEGHRSGCLELIRQINYCWLLLMGNHFLSFVSHIYYNGNKTLKILCTI